MRNRLKHLLKDYSLEEILEANDMEAIDALEILVACGAVEIEDMLDGVDEEQG